MRRIAKWTEKKAQTRFILLIVFAAYILSSHKAKAFGFEAHQKINRMAVFTLPPEMLVFFKPHIEFISKHSIDPDKLAHVIPGEAANHYFDVERYGTDFPDSIPRRWSEALKKYTIDSLQHYGMLPWHIMKMYYRLENAFKENNSFQILKTAAYLGHYIADACTPLHNTKYYNGKNPLQRGIHALWETRIVELMVQDFSFIVGKASYIERPSQLVFALISETHAKTDTVFWAYDMLYNTWPISSIFVFDSKTAQAKLNYSREFTIEFHRIQKKMVERQMQKAAKLTADFWYTAWVNAGQPILNSNITKKTKKNVESLNDSLKASEKVPPPVNHR